MFDKLGGRKAVGLLLLVAIGVTYSALKSDIPDNLLYLLLGSFSVFSGGNVAEHFATMNKAKRGRPPIEKVEVDTSKLDKKLVGLETTIKAISNRTATTHDTVEKLGNYVISKLEGPQA